MTKILPKFLFKKIQKIKYSGILLAVLYAGLCHAGHPGEDMNGMVHPAEALPGHAATPYITAVLSKDMMDGFNLSLTIENFNTVVPLPKAVDSIAVDGKLVMQGHIHLYINGEKKMRIYGNAVHIPARWLKPGINSLTASINNHMHGTFTYQGAEIQTTVLFESEAKGVDFIKNQYSWPRK